RLSTLPQVSRSYHTRDRRHVGELEDFGVRQSGSSATHLCHGARIKTFLSASAAPKVFVFLFLFHGILLEVFLRHSRRFRGQRNQTDKENLWQHKQRPF